ncbi:hypothetical protein TRVL_05385 [Trypanosoma vivax]|nr:hypothetical protein TRVL_05385 [Trypanosoma vivax]
MWRSLVVLVTMSFLLKELSGCLEVGQLQFQCDMQREQKLKQQCCCPSPTFPCCYLSLLYTFLFQTNNSSKVLVPACCPLKDELLRRHANADAIGPQRGARTSCLFGFAL